MLRVTKLKGAEYLIHAVAAGVEDYYMGIGEAPGVWRGRWAAELGLDGVVAADDLRALVGGHDPASGEDWLAGHRDRKVRAIDVTMSVPKSVLCRIRHSAEYADLPVMPRCDGQRVSAGPSYQWWPLTLSAYWAGVSKL